ncbi:hypothetical protein BH18THE2_BH18THE2_27510 [soil metagenome]
MHVRHRGIMTAMSGLQSSDTVKVEPICDNIKSLEAISCDTCQGKLASYDVYMDSGIQCALSYQPFCFFLA